MIYNRVYYQYINDNYNIEGEVFHGYWTEDGSVDFYYIYDIDTGELVLQDDFIIPSHHYGPNPNPEED